jgi:hypothetical protein
MVGGALRRPWSSAVLGVLIFGTVACGGGDPGPPQTGPVPSILITNRSQYALNELRIHTASDYRAVANVLPAPLAVEDEVMFYGVGEMWFTVMREKSERGELLAFTTAEPVELYRSNGYKLGIFDEAFRVEPDTYQRPDNYSGVILGDPGPECTWTSTAASATCPKE